MGENATIILVGASHCFSVKERLSLAFHGLREEHERKKQGEKSPGYLYKNGPFKVHVYR
jgi:hypothetical protein